MILEIIQTSKIVKAVEDSGIKIYWSHTVVDTSGYKRLKNISVMKLSNDGMSVTGNRIEISCDCLGMSGGWTPAVHLFTQSGGKLSFSEENKVFLPNKYPSEQISIGSCNGDFKINEIIKNLSKNLKDFLKIEQTDFDNISVDS